MPPRRPSPQSPGPMYRICISVDGGSRKFFAYSSQGATEDVALARADQIIEGNGLSPSECVIELRLVPPV